MTKGRRPSKNPVERGTLGHSMMSAVADLAPPPSVAEPGSDLQTELKKLDQAALSRPAPDSAHPAGERAATMPQLMPIIGLGATAIIAAAIYQAARGRSRRLAMPQSSRA